MVLDDGLVDDTDFSFFLKEERREGIRRGGKKGMGHATKKLRHPIKPVSLQKPTRHIQKHK